MKIWIQKSDTHFIYARAVEVPEGDGSKVGYIVLIEVKYIPEECVWHVLDSDGFVASAKRLFVAIETAESLSRRRQGIEDFSSTETPLNELP